MPKKRSYLNYAYDVLEQVKNIKNKMENINYEDYRADEDIQLIIERRLEIIGEAISNIDLSILLLVNDDKCYWRIIKDMRNRLIHEYWGVDIKIVYITAKNMMDELEKYILDIILNLEKDLE